MTPKESPYLREPGYAVRYRDQRFTSGTGPGTHRRESRAIEGLLDRAGADDGLWLDLPSGAGRLSELLPGNVVRSDRDPKMLEACGDKWPRVQASALALPFADDAFDGVLCMRLLHHIATPTERIAILRELARVSRKNVIVSFFHFWSLQHLRRCIARRLGKKRSNRNAISWRRFATELREAGMEPIAVAPLRRLVSEQWLVLATTPKN